MYFGQAMGQQQQSGFPVEYDRQIKYLDYMENGERSRGAGFVKFERRGNRCNISLQVNGLYRKDHFTRPLLMMAGGEERELCRLQMANGGIKTCLEGLDCKSLDGQGLTYESLTGLRIPISEGKEILCLWGARASRAESVAARRKQEQNEPIPYQSVQGETVQSEPIQEESMRIQPIQNENVRNELPGNENVRNESPRNESVWNELSQNQSMRSEPVQSDPTQEEGMKNQLIQNGNVQTQFTQDEYSQEMSIHSGRIQNTERRESSRVQSETLQPETLQSETPKLETPKRKTPIPETPRPEIRILDIQKPESRKQSASLRQDTSVPFKEDKWEQLWSIYPHIRPFSDEREYLSFGLSDLVILPARYYRLINNSFLLHGFYNFHHLILTRLNGRNGARYFIGVPGNLYQTEKDTAIMFGFENFECDREPAGKGDFGYYLIQVEL